MSTNKTLSRLFAAAGVAATLTLGAITPSLAAISHRTHAATTHRTYGERAYGAYAADPARTGGYFAHGAPDDPPGSAFQSFGNDQSMGMVR